MTFIALFNFLVFKEKPESGEAELSLQNVGGIFVVRILFGLSEKKLFKHLGGIWAFFKLNICKFKNLYQPTTASLLEESESEILLK